MHSDSEWMKFLTTWFILFLERIPARFRGLKYEVVCDKNLRRSSTGWVINEPLHESNRWCKIIAVGIFEGGTFGAQVTKLAGGYADVRPIQERIYPCTGEIHHCTGIHDALVTAHSRYGSGNLSPLELFNLVS